MINCIFANPGDHGVIAGLKTSDVNTIHHLLALGIVPGSPFVVEQAFPSLVLRIGCNRITLDKKVARSIAIQLDPAPT